MKFQEEIETYRGVMLGIVASIAVRRQENQRLEIDGEAFH